MILVDMEMPKRGCRDCPINYMGDYCNATHKCVTKAFIEDTFPTGCPIKAEILDDADLVIQKKGHWIKFTDGIYQCSNCYKYNGNTDPYCHICGAKMNDKVNMRYTD